MPYSDEMKIFSGSASIDLTQRACAHLYEVMGQATVGQFSDGEVKIHIHENIRGKDVFIINSTSPPINRNLMELLILIDAAKRASAARVTAVMPYFGYARQDRKDRPRAPITAKLVSNMVTTAGADRVLALDLHVEQIQGFFDIPVDHLSGDVEFVRHLKENKPDNLVVVSPDTGSVRRARAVANRLDAPLAIVDKRRPKENESEVMNIIGDVDGMEAILFDDMIDTAGTLVKAAEAIKNAGATAVRACATHGVFSGEAISRIQDSVLEEVMVSDSIPLREDGKKCSKIKVISFAPLIGEAIKRIHEEKSVSILFR
ncbi:MAG: ribose-phosphate pyrophosphokinase [Candidatus Hydrogenedentota bacterium]